LLHELLESLFFSSFHSSKDSFWIGFCAQSKPPNNVIYMQSSGCLQIEQRKKKKDLFLTFTFNLVKENFFKVE